MFRVSCALDDSFNLFSDVNRFSPVINLEKQQGFQSVTGIFHARSKGMNSPMHMKRTDDSVV